MDEEQQFLFDVNGYIVLEDVSRQRSFALAPLLTALQCRVLLSSGLPPPR